MASDRFDPQAKTNFSLARRRHLLLLSEQRFSQTCEPNFLVLWFSSSQSVIMLRRNNTINRNAHECFHSRHQVLTGSHIWSCWDMNCLSRGREFGRLDGDNKTNFDDQQKIGETFPHLKRTKFSRSWFSQNHRQNFGYNYFHLNSIRCKHRRRCYKSVRVK